MSRKPSITTTVQKTKVYRLPPIPKLRVKRPDQVEQNPCIGVMSAMLGCWASSGQAAANCIALEQQLRTCMDMRKQEPAKKSMINHHLNRFYKQVMGPQKKK